MVLGRYGELAPSQARKLAEAARGRVQAGFDPRAERAATIAAGKAAERERKQRVAADAFTLGVLVDEWSALGLASRSAVHRAEAPRAIRTCFADLLQAPASGIDAVAVQQAVDSLAKLRPVMARRARDYARAAFNWAVRRRLVTVNPFAKVEIEARERSRDRVLSDAELALAWSATSIMDYPFGPFFRLLVLTLQRRGEVAGMRWDELAPDFSLWTIPGARTKNGKAHLVHLPEVARAVLRGVLRRPEGPFVFSTTAAGGIAAENGLRQMRPILGFSDAFERLHAVMMMRWDQLAADRFTWTIPASMNRTEKPRVVRLSETARATLAALPRHPDNPFVFADPSGPDGASQGLGRPTGAAVPSLDWHMHDLRRTGVTVLARLGFAPHVADRLLNHVQGTIRGVAAVYQRHEFLPEREVALRAWADHVLAVGEGRVLPDKVIELRRA